MPVSAKFVVNRISDMGWATEVEMVPDYAHGRNKEWAAATPAGMIRMTIKNSVATDQFRTQPHDLGRRSLDHLRERCDLPLRPDQPYDRHRRADPFGQLRLRVGRRHLGRRTVHRVFLPFCDGSSERTVRHLRI